jgi:O-acetyl-ADP-ribose deacetylase (regulator of RNase III)
MVALASGNLLQAQVDALVNTVNTVGVMGKGVAYQFKQAYPENFKAYAAACKSGEVNLGRMFVTHTGQLMPRLIVNFPTKGHWKGNARIDDVRAGLNDLVQVVRSQGIRSIAIPPLGCGLGGLRWEEVRPLIEGAFKELPDVEVLLYTPGQAVAPEDRVVRTPKPAMTAWRAALIKIVGAYGALGYEATHLEAQKLLYFLVTAGEPLDANFCKDRYGPYDPGMRYGLQAMDGHFLVGFGDGERLEPVRLKPGALAEADAYLGGHADEAGVGNRIGRIERLIEGFETPYGLELLATVHWVAKHEGANSPDEAVRHVQQWNDRKRKVMQVDHLLIAWDRLKEENWI